MANEKEQNYTVHEVAGAGSVQIADEVIAVIAALAATEVEGVASMAGNLTNDIIGKLGVKTLAKGVRVAVTEDQVRVDLSLNVKLGYSIPEVTNQVQEKVRTALENMTGMEVVRINIKVADVVTA